MVIDEDWSNWDHQLCVVDEVVKLMDRNFVCYLEHEIPLTSDYRKKLFVDILAIKGEKKILLEIGSLSPRQEGDRFSILKSLMPNAKIIHVHQWKNYGINEDFIRRRHFAYRRYVQWYNDRPEIRDQLLRDLWERFYY